MVKGLNPGNAPTSTGGSVTMPKNTDKTFAATDFTFADVDSGDTLGAIRVTSLPAHGTLKLGGTPITTVPSAAILVASIDTLTFTPAASYTGTDSFKFQVRDATLFSADATMAISVINATVIPVANGSFESPTPVWSGPGAIDYSPVWCDGLWAFIPAPWTANMGNYGRVQVSGISVHGPNPVFGAWMANMTDAGYDVMTQDLHTSVNAGDTLAVTFQVMRDQYGSGLLQASFLVGATEYGQTYDTCTQTVGAWVTLTLNQTIPAGVSGNLSLRFSNVSGRAGWLDNIGNVSVTAAPVSASYAGWATANGASSQTMDQDHDHDGAPNGIEYFLGGSANTTGFTPLPAVVKALDGTRSVTWTKAAAGYSGVYGTDYVVQSSTTLTGTWTDEPATGGGVTLSGNDVKYTFPSGPVQKFARLKVMGTP